MPYEIQTRGGRHCVIKTPDGESMGCHGTRNDALRQQRALYASEQSESMERVIRRFVAGEW